MTNKNFSGIYHKHYAIIGLWVAYSLNGSKQTFYTENDAKVFSLSGTMIEYKGFQISSSFQIFKDGKQVFTAAWQKCDSLDLAKQIIDMSIFEKQQMDNYTEFQLNKYGNIVAPIESTPDGELYESGIEELNRMAEWINFQAERQLQESNY